MKKNSSRPNSLLIPILLLFVGAGGASASPSKAKPLWDNWYTVSIPDPTGKSSMAYATYHEKAEEIPGDKKTGPSASRLHIEVHIRKKEDGFINEEHTGAFAENTKDVRPLFFNLLQTFRSSQVMVDGTFDEKNFLQVRIKDQSAKTDPSLSKRQIPKGTILLSLFPLWFGKNIAEISHAKGAVAFQAVSEDGIQSGFNPDHGKLRILPPDAFAKAENLLKVEVEIQGNKSLWWMKPNGEFRKLIFPGRGMEMLPTTKAEAEKYLN